MAWIRLGGCCLVCSPILRSRCFQILRFRSLHYQIQEDTRLAILLVKYWSLSYLDYTPLGAQKSCSVCNVIAYSILPVFSIVYTVLQYFRTKLTLLKLRQFLEQWSGFQYKKAAAPVVAIRGANSNLNLNSKKLGYFAKLELEKINFLNSNLNSKKLNFRTRT